MEYNTGDDSTFLGKNAMEPLTQKDCRDFFESYIQPYVDKQKIALLDTLQREVESMKIRYKNVDDVDWTRAQHDDALEDVSHLISTMKDTIK